MKCALFPFNPARYPDEPFNVYQLRRWTEQKLIEMFLSPTIRYRADFVPDKKGKPTPFRWKDHGGKPIYMNLRRYIRDLKRKEHESKEPQAQT